MVALMLAVSLAKTRWDMKRKAARQAAIARRHRSRG